MGYELAKELMDAGFAQTGRGLFWIEGYGCAQWLSRPQDHTILAYEPSLEELIEECGRSEFKLRKEYSAYENKIFYVIERPGCFDMERRDTAKEAVARLWLALNSKS